MARTSSKSPPESYGKRNEILPPEDGETSIRFNDPAILDKIREAQNDLEREKTSDRAKFDVAFNDADRLYFVKVEREFSNEQFEAFASACGRSRSTAADLLKLHGHREDGNRWFDAHLVLAGDKRINLSWQAYARERKLIRKGSPAKRKSATRSDGSEQSPPNQIAQLTKERDELKTKLIEIEHERDDARAELEKLRSQGQRVASA